VARHVDQLAGDEVIGGDLGADIEQRVFSDTELGDASLGLDFSLGKLLALRLGDILRLRRASTQLNGDIAVLVNLAARNDLVALPETER
jgi:hypothetical protein